MHSSSNGKPLIFERFVIDPVERELWVDGACAKIGARAFQLLEALAQRRGRVVSKDELLELVWPGMVVEENTLQVHVSALRRLLGSDTIVTVPARGYRFAAIPRSDEAESSRTSPAPPEREALTIAVMPFMSMGADPQHDYFADGVTQDIITELSRWRSLAVTSRDSSFRFKGELRDVQTLGHELGVRYLVQGSIRRIADRVRVSVQLNDAETGRQIWGERFDRPMADLFAVQDEVVDTIVGTLVDRVYASGANRIRRKPPDSLDAYDHVLRGNALRWDDPAAAAEAIREFEQAIAIDPLYGLPHSLLAVQLCRQWERTLSGASGLLDRAMALALRAVELSPDESTCHTILGQICLERRSFDLALRYTERGVEINPSNQWNRADLGIILSRIGRAEEGFKMLCDAKRADPYFGPPWYWRGLGAAEFVLRRYADAVPNLERGAAPGLLREPAMLAGCYAKLGLSERASESVTRFLAVAPDATIHSLVAAVPYKDVRDSLHLAECLRLAGFPE
jgi:TolB-like protein/tetratricopeptide (TPR) repeat protein